MDGELAKLNDIPSTFDDWSQWLTERGAEYTLEARPEPFFSISEPSGRPGRFIPDFYIELKLTQWFRGVSAHGVTVSSLIAEGRGETPLKAMEAAIYHFRIGYFQVEHRSY